MAVGIAAVCVPVPRRRLPPVSSVPNNPAAVGEIGPLIPFHKDAIHVRRGLDRGQPGQAQSLFLDETRRIQRDRPGRSARPKSRPRRYRRLPCRLPALVRGGSEFSDRLDRSVQSRIKDDIPLDNGLCFDLTHPMPSRTTASTRSPPSTRSGDLGSGTERGRFRSKPRRLLPLPAMPPD